MNPSLVASFRKDLELKPTAELRQAWNGGKQTGRSPEELEAIRQILHERDRLVLALGSAAVMAILAAGFAWWQLGPDVFVLLAGVGGAALGVALWYIPDLIPRA